MELPTTEEIKGCVADFREFLQEGTLPERKALIRNFVEGIEVVGDEATLTYTMPMPDDSLIPGRATEKVALNGSSSVYRTRWWTYVDGRQNRF